VGQAWVRRRRKPRDLPRSYDDKSAERPLPIVDHVETIKAQGEDELAKGCLEGPALYAEREGLIQHRCREEEFDPGYSAELLDGEVHRDAIEGKGQGFVLVVHVGARMRLCRGSKSSGEDDPRGKSTPYRPTDDSDVALWRPSPTRRSGPSARSSKGGSPSSR